MLLGVEGSWVVKRKPGFTLENLKEDYHAYFLNFRYNLPEINSYVDLKVGRFLAGDKGVRIDFTKKIGSIDISVWYSFTDTSVFKDSYNRGYHDKGIMFTLPLKWITGKENKTVYSYAITPWTRDVAQFPYVESLFNFIQSIFKYPFKF